MLFPFMFYMVEGKKKEANEKNLAKSLEVNIRSLGRKEKACEDFKRLQEGLLLQKPKIPNHRSHHSQPLKGRVAV